MTDHIALPGSEARATNQPTAYQIAEQCDGLICGDDGYPLDPKLLKRIRRAVAKTAKRIARGRAGWERIELDNDLALLAVNRDCELSRFLGNDAPYSLPPLLNWDDVREVPYDDGRDAVHVAKMKCGDRTRAITSRGKTFTSPPPDSPRHILGKFISAGRSPVEEFRLVRRLRHVQGKLRGAREAKLRVALRPEPPEIQQQAKAARDADDTAAAGVVRAEPQSCLAAGENDNDTVAIPLRAKKAWGQYEQGRNALNREDVTDDEVYDLLDKTYKQSGEQADLPIRDSWKRNLREHRRLTGTQKNAPRAGRVGTAGHFARVDQIEPQSLPTQIRPKCVDP